MVEPRGIEPRGVQPAQETTTGQDRPQPAKTPANSGLSADPGAACPDGLGTPTDTPKPVSDTRKAQNQQRGPGHADMGMTLADLTEAVKRSKALPDPIRAAVLALLGTVGT